MKYLLNSVLSLLLAIFATSAISGGNGGSGGTIPTSLNNSLTILNQIQKQVNGSRIPVVQVSDQQYVILIATFNGEIPYGGKDLSLTTQEVLIKDGVPIIRLKSTNPKQPDVYVVSSNYINALNNTDQFYRDLKTKESSLPRLAP